MYMSFLLYDTRKHTAINTPAQGNAEVLTFVYALINFNRTNTALFVHPSVRLSALGMFKTYVWKP